MNKSKIWATSFLLIFLTFFTACGSPEPVEKDIILCLDQANEETVLKRIRTTLTDDGQLNVEGSCKPVYILKEVETDQTYTRYQVSWNVGDLVEGRQPETGDVESEIVSVDSNSTFILFNPKVSFAWNATQEEINDFQEAMTKASKFLFNATDGQAAFGAVEIKTNGDGWENADIRVLPANDFRPMAFIGGIVKGGTIKRAHALNGDIHYREGAIFLGRSWERDPALGKWGGNDGPRTIVHEWFHYAAFLFDMYIDGNGKKITCDPNLNGVIGLMGIHYNKEELSKDTRTELDDIQTTRLNEARDPSDAERASEARKSCGQSQQYLVYGRSPWETVAENLSLTIPPNYTATIPDLDFLEKLIDFSNPQNLPASQGEEVTVIVDTNNLDVAVGDRLIAQVYGIHHNPQENITYQGSIFATINEENINTISNNQFSMGSITLLGFDNTQDELYVEVNYYHIISDSVEETKRLTYENGTPVKLPDSNQIIVTSHQPWFSSVKADYVLEDGSIPSATWTIVAGDIAYSDPAVLDAEGDVPTLQLCVPETGCAEPQNLSKKTSSTWETTLDYDPQMPLNSIVHIDFGSQGSIVRWVQDGGGVGPAHIVGHAPFADAAISIGIASEEASQALKYRTDSLCNRLILMPAALYYNKSVRGQQASNANEGIIPLDIAYAFDLNQCMNVLEAMSTQGLNVTTQPHPTTLQQLGIVNLEDLIIYHELTQLDFQLDSPIGGPDTLLDPSEQLPTIVDWDQEITIQNSPIWGTYPSESLPTGASPDDLPNPRDNLDLHGYLNTRVVMPPDQ